MTLVITHAKTITIPDPTQADLNAQIALGNYPLGTLLADIFLASDSNANHTLTGTASAAQGGTGVANTGTLTFSGSASVTGTNTGDQTSVTGNAGTATALQTGRAINGVTFDGTAPITVTAAAGTITGTTLNATVVTSSLTSVGTIGAGVWQGTKVGLAYGGTNADLSATGGSGQYLKQNSSGATVTVSAVAESELTFTDITTNNVSTTKHGFAPKLPNDATKYLDGTGAYTVPAGGGGTAVSKAITQASHGFAVQDVIRLSGTSTYTKAKADSAANAEVIGIVSAVAGVNDFTVTTAGYVSGLSGLTANTVYFLDPSTAGALTATEPTTVGQIDKPIFVADTTTSGYIINYRGEIIAAAQSYANGRVTAQTAAAGSIATLTVGASDSSYYVSANVLVTTATVHSFTVTCTYTDEGNTSRTLTLQFSNLAGTFLTAIANAAGTVPYEGVPVQIRCKAATSITIASTGTFTTVTYNAEGHIQQVA